MKPIEALLHLIYKEPEEWLAYLHGQKLDELESYRNSRPPISGAFFHCLYFFLFMLRNFASSLTSRKEDTSKGPEYFLYANTLNQYTSIKETADSLKKRGKIVHNYTFKKQVLTSSNEEFIFAPVKIIHILCATAVLIIKSPSLYVRLKRKYPILTKHFFIFFIQSYFFLIVFHDLLSKNKPSFVIISNDHSVDCRSLLCVARHLSIKTVYMQHASVSEVFPALTVDYAFLDGPAALNVYRKCEKNLPPEKEKRTRPIVILSGQKKPLQGISTRETIRVGIATNRLDDMNRIIDLASHLAEKGIPVSLRWHPRQLAADTTLLQKHFSDSHLVNLSEPGNQDIGSYLSELSHLISGNSSILLESAIAGVSPIYHEVQPPFIEDYYGYVRHGLATKIDSWDKIVDFVKSTDNGGPNVKATRFYSATYLTEWHGKEGDLVATSLIKLQQNCSVQSLWGYVPFLSHGDTDDTDSQASSIE